MRLDRQYEKPAVSFDVSNTAHTALNTASFSELLKEQYPAGPPSWP